MKTIPFARPAVLTAVVLASSLIAFASSNSDERKEYHRVVLPASEIHEGWYFAAGDQVLIEGTVNGDAFVAGGLVEVSGTINGDLIVAGGNVNVSGTVSDDIRAAGGSLRFDGRVGKNLTAAGGTIALGKSAGIGGNILAACGNLIVAGTVMKEAKVAAGNMDVSGVINGTVEFEGERLLVSEGARLGRDVHASVEARENVQIADGTVLGAVDISLPEAHRARHILGFGAWHFWFKVLWCFSLLATGLVLAFVFPRQTAGIGAAVVTEPGRSLLWGILGLIVMPVASILLAVTVIGIPLGLVLLAMFFLIAYLSQLGLGLALAHRLYSIEGRRSWALFWPFAAGLIIVQVLTFVPYLRIVVIVVGLVIGFGAILLMARSEFRKGATP